MSEDIKIQDALSQLETCIQNIHTHFRDLYINDPKNIHMLLASYKQLHEADDRLKTLFDILHSLKNKVSNDTIPETFESMKIDGSIRVEGKNFVVVSRIRANIVKENTEEAYKWLRDNGYDDLIQTTVNANSLSSAVNELFEENATMPPKEVINTYSQRYTSIRK